MDFIVIGFEDYSVASAVEDKDEKRIKSAIRNLYCGFELLLKYYLLSLTEHEYGDALLYQRFEVYRVVASAPNIKGCRGNKSVNYETALDRILNLEIFSDKHENYFNELRGRVSVIKKKRNELEHMHLAHPSRQLLCMVIDLYDILDELFSIINRPRNVEFGISCLKGKLGPTLAGNIEYAKKQYEKIISDKAKIFCESRSVLKYLECVKCFSPAVGVLNGISDKKHKFIESSLQCRDCEFNFSIDSLINDFIKSESFREAHDELKKLGLFPFEVIKILNDSQMKNLIIGIESNGGGGINQILGIKRDPDIDLFLKILLKSIRANSKWKEYEDVVSEWLLS